MDALMLPLNWQRVRLGDIANYLTSNLSAEQITQQGKIKVYDVNNFIGYTNTTFISDKPYISIVKDGSVGRVRILPPKTNILSTMGALIANHKTTTEFLFYLLSNFDFKNFTSGSIIPHIYFKDYKEKTISLPPLDEQIAIANILSALDHYLYSLDALILKKESVKKALSFELLSQRKRLKGFNQAWQRVRLGDIFFITAGGDLSKPHYSNTKQSDFNYPIYSNAIEKKGLYGYSSFFIIKNKSITITSRGTIGVAFFRDYPYVPIGRLLVLQPKISNIDCRFYTEYINSKVKFNTEQTTIPQLTIPKVALCEIPLPPLNEQIAIANILSALDHEIISLKNKKRQFENIKKALNHDLMSAKIRVLKK